MTAQIHATALIADGAEIDAGVSIGPFCVIGAYARIAKGVVLHDHVTITGNTHLAEDVEVFQNSVVGASPQIVGFKDTGVSRVEIGARTILREHVSIHAGSTPDDGLTSIGADCMFMANTHAGHDCKIGDKCVIANGTQIGGHVVTGEQVWMGGQVAVHQFCRIGKHGFVGGGAILVDDVIPYGSVIGNRAYLAGLNVIGLKRRGFSRDAIGSLRAATKLLFAGEGSFANRLDQTESQFSESTEVMDIVNFIKSDHTRSICMPK
ncbi:MAG: acyl-ACP--UDP-N-acetylglucosamine O-acyltransferase [Hyphomonadaceae bacterium]